MADTSPTPSATLWFARCSSSLAVSRRWRRLAGDDRRLMHDPAVTGLCMNVLGALRSALRTRAELALENLALRQQLANLRRTSGRPRLRKIDRAFWLVLSRLWSRWADVLVIVEPQTVVRWHRAGFRVFWRWKSGRRTPAKTRSPRRPRPSSARWPKPTRRGERQEFTAN